MYNLRFSFFNLCRTKKKYFTPSQSFRQLRFKHDDKVAPILPVLEAVVKHIQDSGGFSKKFKNQVIINMVCQGYGTNVSLLHAMQRLGLSGNLQYVGTKLHTTSSDTRKHFNALGIRYFDFLSYSYRFPGFEDHFAPGIYLAGYYYTAMSQYYCKMIEALSQDLLSNKRYSKVEFLALVDEGAIYEQEYKKVEEKFKNYHVVALGHSTSDLSNKINESLSYPKISMGGAAIKTIIEAEEIALANLSRLEEELSIFSETSKKEVRFGVLGCGNIGRNTICELLKKSNDIIYYDLNNLQYEAIKIFSADYPSQLIQAKNTLDLFNQSDVILSCAGQDVTIDIPSKLIQKREKTPLKHKIVFNFASGEREFGHWLKQIQTKENPIIVNPLNGIFPDCLIKINNDDELIIKFSGMPSNMKPGKIHGLPPEIAQLIRALKLAALYQLDQLINALKFPLNQPPRNFKNYIKLDAKWQRFILEEYFHDLNKRYPEKKEKHDKILEELDIATIEERSNGVTQACFIADFFKMQATNPDTSPYADWDNLPSKNRYFQLRPKLIRKLTRLFQKNTQQCCVLVGLGGNGKTSLAQQWANDQKIKGKFSQVRVMRMDKVNLRLSLIAFAKDCGLVEVENDDSITLWRRILKSVTAVRSLIIWDNVDNEQDVHKLLANLSPQQALLITSRDMSGFRGLPILPIDSFEPNESYDYILQQINKQNDFSRLSCEQKYVSKLTTVLAHHPLALELVMGQISKMHLEPNRLETVLNHLEKHPLRNLNAEKSGDNAQAFLNRYNLNTLWQLSETHLPSSARALLQYVSFLYPEGLCSELLLNFLTVACSDKDPNTVMDMLCRQSLLQQKTTWQIHRVLQRVIREDTLLSQTVCSWPDFFKKGLLAYEKTFCQKTQEGDIARCQEAILHGETWLSYTSEFSKYLSTTELLEWKARLQRHLGKNKGILADYASAESAFTEAWSYYEKFNDTYCEDKAEILLQWGAISFRQGTYPLAKRYLEKSSIFSEKIDDITIKQQVSAEIKYRFGHIFLAESNIAAARNHYHSALDIYQKIYGENTFHYHIAAIFHRLGRVCYAEGNFPIACNYYLKAHKMYLNIYGKKANHPNIAANLHELGRVFCAEEKFLEAHDYFEKSLAMKDIVYSAVKNHPNIAATLYERGKIYSAEGDFTKAHDNYTKALAMKYAVYGEKKNHPHIASTLHELGVVYQNKNDYKKARSYYEQSLAMMHMIYGLEANQATLANTLHELGRSYLSQGDHAKARDYYNQALQMRYKIYREGTNHPDIADSLHSLGVVCQNEGNYDEAYSYYTQALTMRYAIFKGNHSSIAGTLHELGRMYFTQGNFSKALDYYMQSINMNRTVHGLETNHSKIATTLYQLGNLYLAEKDTINARSYFKQALTMSKAIYGGKNAKHTGIALTLYQLGKTSFIDNDLNNARDYYNQALEMYEILYRKDAPHVRVLDALEALSQVCQKQSDDIFAKEYAQKAFEMKKKIAEKTLLSPHDVSNQKRNYCSLSENSFFYFQQKLKFTSDVFHSFHC